MGNEFRHTNLLVAEKSPYLRQHAHNPVAWHPWGEAAFARARAENKPVFLSIGYSTCHWCHVMERESFEDEALGAYLNEHFISIKVDREERPDVDKIYMTFVQATTGSGGWPLNVFLTPELKPFYGDTYFPPVARHGRPAFRDLLGQIVQLWQERRGELDASAQEMHARLEVRTALPAADGDLPDAETLKHAAATFMAAYDARHGGFGGAPKFPQPSIPLALLRAARRFDLHAGRDMVLHTCERMAAGGIHDQLGGGFARYAVDAQWLVPHFEKMLYDNAQLAQLYLDAFLASGRPDFASVVRDILEYVRRDLTHPDGGFYSAEDADSEGQEGKFYCWTTAELSRLLTPAEYNVVVTHYGISPAGNFVDHSHPDPLPGLNVLSVVAPVAVADAALFASARAKMQSVRATRVRPHRDEKILASWNGLMLGAFARAGMVLREPDYVATAERNLAFLRAQLWDETRQTLYHRWCDGARDGVQLLEGHAFLLDGVLHVYEATLDPGHLEFAVVLARSLIATFYDAAQGGFWQSPAGQTDLILRLKDEYDGAEPSGNSVATLALLRLAAITGRAEFQQPAVATLRLLATRLAQRPEGLAYLLHAVDFQVGEPVRVVIAGDPAASEALALRQAAQAVYQPNKVVLGNVGPVDPFARVLIAHDGPLAYVCAGSACKLPTRDPSDVMAYTGGGSVAGEIRPSFRARAEE